MIIYLMTTYAFVALMCIAGQFNRSFNGNSFQRLGLAMASIWAIWRIQMLSNGTWGYPHEPLLATSMGLYALGTLIKTKAYCNRRKRAAKYLRNKRHIDDDRLIDKLRGYALETAVFFKCLINKTKHLISKLKRSK